MGLEPVYRGIVAVDIERFARPTWADPTRARLRARLHQLLDQALAQAGVQPSQARRSDTGDGVLLLIASEVPTTRLLHPLVSLVADQLRDDNGGAPGAERLRLRMAVHAGEAIADSYGYTGEALNHAARLLNAQAGRAILDAVPDSDLVLLASEQVYHGVIKHAYEGIDPAAYQPVWVSEKETSTRAWVHLPGLATQPELGRLALVPVAPRHGPPTQPTPRELPSDIGDFTGREQELERLQGLLRRVGDPSPVGAVVISAIEGMGGVGKSALAIHAAHQLADAFPDGQLYLNLHGATPGLAPLEPIAALDRLLQSLGVPAGQVPAETDAAAARWRSIASDRRLLIVLDNAATAAQVLPLLPGSATSAVLVTSRRVLTALSGATHLPLDTLTPQEAVELVARLAGPHRVAAEPEAAKEIARLCGCLPLALRLAGARLARRPAWPLRLLVDRLATARRLDELHDEHLGVRASVQVSYQELHDSPDRADQQAAQAFRLLGILDAPDTSVPIAARLLDQPEAFTEELLELLVDAQLLQSPTPDRYRLHDLLRLFAREQSARDDPDPARLAALARVLDCYLATARQTSHLLQPTDSRRAGGPADRASAMAVSDRASAVGWLDREHANILALAQHGATLPDQLAACTVALARALFWGMQIRAHYRDHETLGRLGVQVAQRLGDHRSYAHLLTDLGVISWRLGRFEATRMSLEQALGVLNTLGDRDGQARALNTLGVVHLRQGRWQAARTCYEQALRLFRDLGDRRGEAAVLGNLGSVAQELGELAAAVTYHQQDLAVSREVGNRHGESQALANLGESLLRQDHWQTAIRSCEQAITIAQELGDRDTEGWALNTRGEAHRRAGDLAHAVDDQQHAITIARETGDQSAEARALWRLGLVSRDLDQLQRARDHWQAAVAIFDELGAPQAQQVRRLLDAATGEETIVSGHD